VQSGWDYLGIRLRASRILDEAREWSLRQPILLAILLLGGGIAGLLINRAVGPKRYQASVGVTLSAGAGTELPAILSNLASAGSFQLPGQTTPLAFQSYILGADAFLDTLLLQPERAGCASGSCRLVDHLASDGSLRKGRETLRERLNSARDERGRIITIAFADRDSSLARATVDSAVAALGRINRTLVAEAAEAKVAFLSGQLPILTKSLNQIQDSLTYFYRTNRTYGSSPELRFREEQLKALYDTQARLIGSIREQIARGEVQARGGLQVVQTILPVYVDPRPIRPYRTAAAALGALLAAMLGFVWWRQRAQHVPPT
jgi:hypothetical protein